MSDLWPGKRGTCRECEFHVPIAENLENVACIRFPPQAMALAGPRGMMTSTGRPQPRADWTCGEWRPERKALTT